MNKSEKVLVFGDFTFCECNRDIIWSLSTTEGEGMSPS